MRSTLHASLHHSAARAWSEPHFHPSQFVYPLFVSTRESDRPIEGLAPNLQWGQGADGEYGTLVAHLQALQRKGLQTVMLFGVVEGSAKDARGSWADDPATPVIRCTQKLRAACPGLQVACDVCLDEYTDHGHCGVLRTVDGEQVIDNAKTLERLSSVAVAYAHAGAHMVCPSDMMDNRIQAIRQALTQHGFPHVSIMAYTSKKASCMYAPFRDAVESTFKGDRKRYQHPVGSVVHAEAAFQRDVQEDADSVIVKPALFYGDLIARFAAHQTVPVVAYVVSGEYKMLLDYGNSTQSLDGVVREAHLSLLRAGASVLITYFTPLLLEHWTEW